MMFRRKTFLEKLFFPSFVSFFGASAAVVEQTNSSSFFFELVRGRSRVCIPGSHHSFIESRFTKKRNPAEEGIRVGRCGDEGFDNSI